MQLTEITIKDLVDNQILKSGTRLFLDNFDSDKYSCEITEDAMLLIEFNNSIKKWPFPSGAAKSITKISINGWIKWFLLDDNNDKVFLSELRLRYFNQKKY